MNNESDPHQIASLAEDSAEPTDVPLSSFAIATDSPDVRRTHSAIVDSEARLRDLLATLELSTIMVRTLSGTILYWSEGCARLFGWTAAEAIGQKTHDLLKTVSPVTSEEIEAELLAKGEWRGDLRETPKGSEPIVVSVRKVLRRDETGAPVAIAVAYDDVTRLRQAQMELEQLNQRLENLVEEEVRKREAAQQRAAHAERIQALGRLAGGIAHDLNNVLQAVSSGASLTTRDAENPERVRRLARLITEAAGRGAAVTRRLLSFSRRGDLRAEPIDPASLLTEIVDVLAYTLGSNIRFEVQAPADLPRLLADRGQLETALVNLATNARDAMPNGGMIVLSAAAETVTRSGTHPCVPAPGRYIRLTVRDHGTGMDAAILARAQEPFFSTKRGSGGAGLGLATAGGFVRQSGGAIGIESAPGAGTAVSLWLPQSSAAASPARPAPEPLREDSNDPTRPVRVLFVDDDTMVRDVMAQELEQAGYAVTVRDEGTAALQTLGENREFDVLICDLSMPGMSGIEVIKAAQSRRPGLAAILLSGYAGDAAALPAGGASFALLRKPATVAQLADVIALLMGGNEGSVADESIL
jgi:PAS domain S-box-containing protein